MDSEASDTFEVDDKLPMLNGANSNDSFVHTVNLYHRKYLETLSKSELIDIIIEIQGNNQRHIKKRRHHRRHNEDSPKHRVHKKSKTLPFNRKTLSHPHEATIGRKKAQERMGTNYEKIKKQRAVIKALKEERKKLKENPMDKQTISSLSTQEIWIDPHEKTVTGIKATERMATNYDLIEKRRADIKALKKWRKREKIKNGNSIKWRRERAHKKMLGLFNHAHEQSFKPSFNINGYNQNKKRKERKSRLTLKRVRLSDTASIQSNKGKVRIMRDDEVLRFSEEIPIDNFLNAINSGFVKIMNEQEQNEEYIKASETAKSMMIESDFMNYQYVVTEYNDDDDDSDSDSDWDDKEENEEDKEDKEDEEDGEDGDDEHDEEDEEDEEDEGNEENQENQENDGYDKDEEMLQKELLLLSIKNLKRKCKEKRLSAHGGKLELISKIIQKKREEKNVDDD